MIELNMVRKAFGHKEVIKELRLEVRKNELLSLVGPSGCGKTTTLNIIAGLCEPDGGTVVIDGAIVDGMDGKHRIHASPYSRRIGYVVQDYALFPHMTAGENISYGLKTKHLPRNEAESRTRKLLQFVSLADHSESYPSQLSGGQKQRVALARALAIEPEILLLDEPLAALDPRTRESIRSELKKMLDALNVTTIYVTHELEEAYELSNRIAVMGDGRIEQVGQREDILRKPNSAFVADFLGHNFRKGPMVS
jgi:iron(III) transport system ATP-binding protein